MCVQLADKRKCSISISSAHPPTAEIAPAPDASESRANLPRMRDMEWKRTGFGGWSAASRGEKSRGKREVLCALHAYSGGDPAKAAPVLRSVVCDAALGIALRRLIDDESAFLGPRADAIALVQLSGDNKGSIAELAGGSSSSSSLSS